MTEYALLVDNQFREIRNYNSKPDDILHKNVTWHEVVRETGETAFTGLENGNWVIRTALPTFAVLKQQKLDQLATLRWQKETGGMTFNSMLLSTDAVSQTKYIGAVVGVQIDPLTTLNWKLSDGAFVTLDAAAITAVAMAVRGHIQACFDNEATIRATIEIADDQEELDLIDLNVGWPT
jgi:hypothetical protein